MKKYERTENFEQANKMMEADKAALSEGCKSLVLQDAHHLFSRYFEIDGLPSLHVLPQGKGYEVTLTFTAAVIKKFNVLK